MRSDGYIGWKLAWSYFSRFPVRIAPEEFRDNERVYRAMLLSIPAVGAGAALAALLSWHLLGSLQWYGALVSALIYMFSYGFLHNEAVADVADALYAAHSGKDPYEVIKDPAVGAMGLFYGMALALLKISGIVYLLLHDMEGVVIAAAIGSRLGILPLFLLYDFRSSFASRLKNSVRAVDIAAIFPLYTVAILLCAGSYSILAVLLLCVMGAVVVSRHIVSTLGFANGDMLGTVIETGELIFIIGAALWL